LQWLAKNTVKVDRSATLNTGSMIGESLSFRGRLCIVWQSY